MTHIRQLFIAVLAFAGTSVQAGHALLFDRLGESDGLPGTEIYALLEDRQGMVWIGTEAGLARMEGTRVRTWQFDPKDSTSLSNNLVNGIAEDEHGTIWVATMHGFQRYLPERNAFERYHIPHADPSKNGSDRIYSLVPDRHGSLWLLTDNGLWRYHQASRRLEEIHASSDPSIGPCSTHVRTWDGLAYDSTLNGLWCSTRDGLCFLDFASNEWYGPDYDPKGWGCFTKADAHALACDGTGGVWWFNFDARALVHAMPRQGRSASYKTINGEPMNFGPQWMDVTRDGALWISTWTYRCLRLDPEDSTWTSLRAGPDSPQCLRSSNVKSFLEDRHGTLWFGTYSGLDVALPERQVLALHSKTVPDAAGAITALYSWAGDTLLIGTHDGKLFFSTGGKLPRPVAYPRQARPGAINGFSRRNGRQAWVSTSRGPWILDMDAASCMPWSAAPQSLMQASVQDMLTDRRGDTWACTWDHGLFVRRARTGSFEQFHDTLQGAHNLPWRNCLDLLATKAGDLLIGLNNSGGLCRFIQGRPGAERYLGKEGNSTSSCGVVLCMDEGTDGSIWAGTHEGGIAQVDLNSGSWREFTHEDGLPSNRVNSVLLDNDGGVWALTDRGLAHLQPGARAFLPIPLPSDINPRGISSNLAQTADGCFSFAIGNLLAIIDPARISEAHDPPHALITAITIGDSTFWSPGKSALLLPAGQRSLSIEWGSNDPLHGGQTRFAHRVLPDSSWIGTGHAGRIDVNGLSPGTYRVEVRASLGDGLWGLAASTPVITVPPPFIATWWFRSAMLLVLAIIGWLAVRIYVNRKLATQQMAFEREQAVLHERMRIAGDMHDDLGSGLSALKLRTEMALRSEQDPVKKEQLQAVAGTAGELIGSMRQFIWTMNSNHGGLEDLVVYATSYARSYLAEHRIALGLQADGPWPSILLSSEQRRNIFLVLKEALHNVVKHAGGTRVRAGMRMEGNDLVLIIADDGKGLPANAMEGMGNGLRNMRKRAEALCGHLEINCGGSTTVLLKVPLSASD